MNYEILKLDNLHSQQQENNSDYFSFSVFKGENLCIMSEDVNSRLFIQDCLLGNTQIYSGQIYVDSTLCKIDSIETAHKLGIYQINNDRLFENLTIANNLFLINLPVSSPLGILNEKNLYKKAETLLNEFDVDYLKPTKKVHTLTDFQKFILALLRAFSYGARIIIVDFSFSRTYTNEEFKLLLSIFQKMKSLDITVLCFCSSWLPIFNSCDRICTIQDGVITRLQPINNTSVFLTSMNSGFSYSHALPNNYCSVVLECSAFNYITDSGLKNIAFELHENEILGILDCHNHLKTQGLMNDDYNKNRFISSLRIKELSFSSKPSQRQKLAIVNYGFQNNSIIPTMTLVDNVTLLAGEPMYNKIGFLRSRISKFLTNKLLSDIKREDLLEKYGNSTDLQNISPDDQFAISICRWLLIKPTAFIFYNNAADYSLLSSLSTRKLFQALLDLKVPIIIISSSLEELNCYCTRIIQLDE